MEKAFLENDGAWPSLFKRTLQISRLIAIYELCPGK
jgi:hypothetical protein